MTARIIDDVALGIAALVGVAIVLTIVAAARHRPRLARRQGPAPYRVRGRSIRGWQASAIREIRRAGRQHGRRGR